MTRPSNMLLKRYHAALLLVCGLAGRWTSLVACMPQAPQMAPPLQARLEAVKCYYRSDGQMRAAASLFEREWNSEHPAGDPAHVTAVHRFIQYNVEKLESTYSLLDREKPGRPRKPEDEKLFFVRLPA